MDFYLKDDNAQKRLISEWELYGSLVVAFDFDNTVYDYHNSGHSFHSVIALLQECHKLGFHLIVFTSCEEDRFLFIREYLDSKNIPFNSINETPDFIPFKGRKVYYNILLDDRAGLSSAYKILSNVVYEIKGRKLTDNLTEIG